MSATYKNGERDDVMSEQKYSTQRQLFLAVILAVLTGFAIPAFGQDASAPATPRAKYPILRAESGSVERPTAAGHAARAFVPRRLSRPANQRRYTRGNQEKWQA